MVDLTDVAPPREAHREVELREKIPQHGPHIVVVLAVIPHVNAVLSTTAIVTIVQGVRAIRRGEAGGVGGPAHDGVQDGQEHPRWPQIGRASCRERVYVLV